MAINMTKKRQAILAVLKGTPGTLSAAAIHTVLPDTDLVTIYRTLELFTKEKLIKQFHLTGSEAQYEYQSEPHHHAVCQDCHKIIHFSTADEKIKQLLALENFAISDIEMTVRGTCSHHKQ